MSLNDDLCKLLKRKKTMFTTPSHDGTGFILPDYEKFLGRRFLSYDCSEYDGFDNFSSPNGIIKNAQEICASILGAENLFFLVNGSSSGVIGAMLSCLRTGDKVLIARNCHKSVYNGLVLTGAFPYWIMPEFDEDWGICGEVSPKSVSDALNKYNKIKALIITSPTYNGICSNVAEISEICRKKGVILIVDEAHGALKQFFQPFSNAVTLGADISVQSLHKNCGAPNPCAVLLRRKNSIVSVSDIQNSLNLINTTSPSYPLISASDACIRFLSSKKGKEKINRLYSDILDFKNKLAGIESLNIYGNNDFSKILIKIDNLSGYDLSEILYDDFDIEDELANEKSVLFLCGIGTNSIKLNKLKNALVKIVMKKEKSIKEQTIFKFPHPETRLTPKDAFGTKIKYIETEKSQGKTCGELISECPPEVPVLLPGEIIRREHIDYLMFKMKKNLIGIIG